MATPGPAELVRLAHIAREHYVAGKTRVDIANECARPSPREW